MDGSEQRGILEQYMKVCLDTTLKEEYGEYDFLQHIQRYKKSIPETVYMQAYQEAEEEVIADYEEDGDLRTGSGQSVTFKGINLTVWSETNDSEYCDYESGNHAVCLEWKNRMDSCYEMSFHEKDLRGRRFLFNVMNVYDNDSATGGEKFVDITVRLTDSSDHTASLKTSNYQTIYPPVKVAYSKLMVLDHKVSYKRKFQTIEIPLEDARVSDSELDLSNIKKITFLLNHNQSGKILLDQIGFLK